MVLELEMEGKLQPPLSTMLVITRGAIVMIKIFPNWMRMIIISLNIAETEIDENGDWNDGLLFFSSSLEDLVIINYER